MVTRGGAELFWVWVVAVELVRVEAFCWLVEEEVVEEGLSSVEAAAPP